MNAFGVLCLAAVVAMAAAKTVKLSDEDFHTVLSALHGAEPHEFPHQVQLMTPENMWSHCGGTIYNDRWIVTAAHCVKYNGETYTVAGKQYVGAGIVDLRQADKDKDLYPIEKVIVHENWNDDPAHSSDGSDIALIKLATSLPLEVGKIQPLRMEPEDHRIHYPAKALHMGLGATGQGPSNWLISFEVPVHEGSRSARLAYEDGKRGQDSPQQPAILSVAGDYTEFSVGKGDSGGPAVCADDNNLPILCGIASYTFCDAENRTNCRRPSFYTRVKYYIPWIVKNIREAGGNPQQPEQLLVKKEVFPTRLHPEDAPGYLVRILGHQAACTGTLFKRNAVIIPASCAALNSGGNRAGLNFTVYHFRSGRSYPLGRQVVPSEELTDWNPNISQVLNRTWYKGNFLGFKLKEEVPAESFQELEMPPKGYKITEPAIEYSMNEKLGVVEARRYLEMDQTRAFNKMKIFDEKVKTPDKFLYMYQDYSSEMNCEREIGGPLVCEDNIFCGMKIFHGCKTSAFPEIFINHLLPPGQREDYRVFKTL